MKLLLYKTDNSKSAEAYGLDLFAAGVYAFEWIAVVEDELRAPVRQHSLNIRRGGIRALQSPEEFYIGLQYLRRFEYLVMHAGFGYLPM